MKNESIRIHNLRNPSIIDAFFGSAAKSYDYSISEERFNREDNEGPGRYCGVEVSEDQARKWDAGIRDCKSAGISTRSLDGLRLRLAKYGRADRAETLYAELEQQRSAPIIASWHKETDGCELVSICHMPGWYIVIHPTDSLAVREYAMAVADRAVNRHGWAWVCAEQCDADMLSAIRGLWMETAPGWLTNRDGVPESDSVVAEKHSHAAISHHLRGVEITVWPRADFVHGRAVVVRRPTEIAVTQENGAD